MFDFRRSARSRLVDRPAPSTGGQDRTPGITRSPIHNAEGIATCSPEERNFGTNARPEWSDYLVVAAKPLFREKRKALTVAL